MAIIVGDLEELATLIMADPTLVHTPSTVSHPTLLQFVACEAADLPDPVGASRVLVEAGADMQAPLVAAAGCGSHEVVAFILDAGANIDEGGTTTNPWTPLDEALYWSNLTMARYLLERGARLRALSTAAGMGDLGTIAACFDHDGQLSEAAGSIGSPFADSVPPALADDQQSIVDHAFVMAANCGQLTAAKVLLERGARVNSTPPGYHWHGTALHAAVAGGDRALVEWLLECGADPTIRDGLVGSDAAGWAAHHGHDSLLELLATR